MPRTGRPPRTVQNERVTIYLPKGLTSRLNSRTWDPFLMRPRVGAKGEVIAELLRLALDALDAGQNTVSLSTLRPLLEPPLPGDTGG